MFNEILKEKFEYFTNYFEAAVKNAKSGRALVHSIILYGQDSLAQYYLAQEISRILNCKEGGKPDCVCINCNWVRNNQHPAVLTVSKNDNNPSDKEAKKSITVTQARSITANLIQSSEYYRVFIFCDSEIKELTAFEQKHLKDFEGLAQSLPQSDWFPQPIHRESLQDVAANALLKSIEEPPENLLFIFLTDDRENIIETIVSRSQSFYIPSFDRNIYDLEIFQEHFRDYPSLKKQDVQSSAERLLKAAEAKNYSVNYLLDSMEFYLAELIKSNLGNKFLAQKIKKDILKIQHSKKQATAYIKPQLVLENLLFGFC